MSQEINIFAIRVDTGSGMLRVLPEYALGMLVAPIQNGHVVKSIRIRRERITNITWFDVHARNGDLIISINGRYVIAIIPAAQG